MSLVQSLLLGLIEGLTEFIPVSSTGHMLFAQRILGIPPSDSVFAYLVLIQLGPLVALLVYFWRDLWNLIKSFFAKPFSTAENRLAWYIVIGTIPALGWCTAKRCCPASVSKSPFGSRHPFLCGGTPAGAG